MQNLVLIILLLLIPTIIFAGERMYIFVVDENSKPMFGYKILETQRDDIYITKIDPIKKWINILHSQLIVVKDGHVYPVKDSVIVDKKKGVALVVIDFTQRKSLYFNPEEILIDKNTKLLHENKKKAFLKIKDMFPSEVKKVENKKEKAIFTDYIALAETYEKNAQWSRALSIYEELLKKEPNNKKIIHKIGVVYYHLSEFKKAKEYFERLPKDNEETIGKLVGIYIIEKDFEKALQIINNSGLKTPYFHYLKGVIYYLTNKKDEAYKEVSILLQMDLSLAQNLRDLLR
ncbi:MAG: tetratricopeptide repeat protein [Thermodesulfovibrio sp.]|nr:tetratricopeptide repeat protein [Thermodesulfovibrio sp.]